MTRNTPRATAPRMPAVLTAALLTTAVAVGLSSAPHTTGAVAAETPESPACLTDDLTGTIHGRPRIAGSATRDAIARLTNISGRTCRLEGWADIAMVTEPGELVPVPTRQVGQATGKIVLAPGAGVSSRLQWDTCDPGADGCGVGVALQYVVDPESTGTLAELSAVPEADRTGITMTALRIGPLQSSPSPTD